MENQAQKAVEHLEIGRRLEPETLSSTPVLASAYDQLGEHSQARLMRACRLAACWLKNRPAPRAAAAVTDPVRGFRAESARSGTPVSRWIEASFQLILTMHTISNDKKGLKGHSALPMS